MSDISLTDHAMGERLKPFHLFEYQGCRCLINIEDTRAQSIDEPAAVKLLSLQAASEAEVESDTADTLKTLGLLGKGPPKNLKKAQTASIPISKAALFLTQACNLNCVYCYGEGGSYGDGGSMDQKTAFQAVDWLIALSGNKKKIHVGFFGGEPFLAFPMMKAVTQYAQRKGREVDKDVEFHATTNATLLDDEKIAFVKENDISVTVSLDGPRKIQDAQRPFANGGSSYDAALPRIRKILKACPKTEGHAVITGRTDPARTREALLDMGFAEVSLMPASKSLFEKTLTGTKTRRNLDGFLKLMAQDAETWIQHIRNRDSGFLKKFMNQSELHHLILAFLHNTGKKYHCGAGLGLVGISCTGNVYLCHRFVGMDAYRLGNVFSNQLNRDPFLEVPATFIKKCRGCFARFLCAGGCKHDNAAYSGSMFEPAEDACHLMRSKCEIAAYTVSLLTNEDRKFLSRHEIFPVKFCPLDF